MEAKDKVAKVRKISSMSKRELIVFSLLVLTGVTAVANYFFWWFDFSHIVASKTTFWSVNLALFVMLSFVIWHGLFSRLAIWFVAFLMRRPVYMSPQKGLKVAMLTCFVPGKEPYDLLEKTLKAMVEVEYPHDTWVLDEGDDPVVKEMCKRLGVFHFSRKGIAKYNQENGPFKAKTKSGNHNAWRDRHEKKYDIIAQMDMDHIPYKNYLMRILGYFRDPEIAFVVAPQIYANTENWIARGASEQAYIFHGPLQQGFFGHDMPLFIGTNHAYRKTALKSVGGYASTIVEDLLTGMNLYAKGWKGVYVPEAISAGEGPTNWVEYLNQQMRWAYGTFEVAFKHAPKLLMKMPWNKKVNYIGAISYYLSGVAVMTGIFLTSLYLAFGYSSSSIDLTAWLLHSVPPFAIAMIIHFWLQRFNLNPKEEFGLGLRGMLLSIGAMPIFALAFFKYITGQKLEYMVTAKGSAASETVPLKTFNIHIFIAALSFLALVASFVHGNDAIHLRFWAAFTVVAFSLVVLSSRSWHLSFNWNLFPANYTGRLAVITFTALVLLLAIPVYNTVGQRAEFVSIDQVSAAPQKLEVKDVNKILLGVSGDLVWKKTDFFEKQIGKEFLLVGKYQAWGNAGADFDFELAEELKTKGQILMITWEPWTTNYTGKNYDQPLYSLKNITDGKFDNYIRRYAQDVKIWNHPVVIRFAHEMNGTWYPWGASVNGNTPEDYRNAWKHIYGIFASEGVKNVTWVWSPNEPYRSSDNPYSSEFDAFYPGDEYVDWVAFSAYNWGTAGSNSRWRTFSELVDPSYRLLSKYEKPLMISEMNTTDRGGDKGQWLKDMNFEILKFPRIKAVVWFDSPAYNFHFDTSSDSYRVF